MLLLWGFYKIFLEKENIHFLKRFYLLFSVIFAFIIPMITLTYEVEVFPQPEVVLESEYVLGASIPSSLDIVPILIEKRRNYLPIILWSIYIAGVLLFGIRFIRNISNIYGEIKSNQRISEESHINVLLHNSIIPHTFLSYIFVPKKEFQDKNIPAEVLLHEKTHVVQKHTLDILFVEILQVLFWFNPLLFFIKKSIKLNHEFLADHNVLKQQCSIQNYVDLLLNYPNSPNQAVLSSSINYLLTKKRLQMMTQKFSKKRVVLKLTALVPIVCLCILFFNNQIVAKEVLQPFNELSIEEIRNSRSLNESIRTVLEDKSEKRVKLLRSKAVDFQDGVTKEELATYKAWITEFKRKQKEEKGFTIVGDEVEKMRAIYQGMNSTQKNEVEKFPDSLIPPSPPEPFSIQKGEENAIPLPPPTPEVPEVPEVPEAPEVPKTPSVYNGKDFEITFSENSNLTEQEKKAYIKRVEATLARERALLERVKAIEQAELARFRAKDAEEEGFTATIAMLEADEIRQIAEDARIVALEASKKARNIAQDARITAIEAAKGAREEAMKARENTIKAAIISKKEMRKLTKEIRKVKMEARKEILKAERQAMKIDRKQATNKLIERMAKEDADFYYNGKQISAKKALKLIKKSDHNISIDASTNSGKSKVKLKN